MDQAASHRAPLGGGLAALFLAGCTMCPDPFDYSGPVPNGSAPQSDFRARSNGIVPIGMRPRPWPPIVKRSPPSAEAPTVAAAPIPEVIADGPLDVAAAFHVPVADTDAEMSDVEEAVPEPLASVPAAEPTEVDPP